jgi:transcriptional regulator GlxA family with amidase domain
MSGNSASRCPRRVAICVWDEAELLDFAGPGEVFAAAGGGKAFEVYTVSERLESVVSQGFLRVIPEYSITDCPRPDIVVVPGGGATQVLQSPSMVTWLLDVAQTAEIVLSVCTGSLVLAKTGLLDGLEATTWHGAITRLRHAAPNTIVHDNRRYVDNGKIVTSAGVSAGIDAALHIVGRLCGPAVAAETARYMEYQGRPADHSPEPIPP